MKIRFKHQQFQADAAKAVADVFAGQPRLTAGRNGEETFRALPGEEEYFTGQANAGIVPELTDEIILENINRIQRENGIPLSSGLEGRYNLTVEMETGVGKTYTYIKTIYELNRRYGWTKFIVVVPGIAVREGVYKAFEMTREHFGEEYGENLRFFLYDSSRLTDLWYFAMGGGISVMIINSQAFNAKGKEARRIYMPQDAFCYCRPIDAVAKTRPIMIIDEPQSVEGKQTRENMKEFHPLITLRYSATHRADSLYNMIYRLDALDAYNMRLVKKIAVKGIAETGTPAGSGYLYLESVDLSREAPRATLQFDVKGPGGIRRKSGKAGVGYDLYEHSGGLSEYRDGFVVKNIDGRDNSVEFINGIRLCAGEVMGEVSREQLRRIQIRETILSHLERERQLFDKGIKVLSLFFVDEVAHYREYDGAGQPRNGIFARMFEEEYRDILENMQYGAGDEAYREYLERIEPCRTHAGYFSVDKKGRMVDRVAGDDRRNAISNDREAYDLIMKNKELLLDRDPERSPVRFLFSHSALREGWDNPNVFQICTLKRSGSQVRKRQEVGRGLRLCVNQEGERMDAGALGRDVHKVNVLTVIASESYDSFARGLQTELAETGSGYDSSVMKPENARDNDVELRVDQEKLKSREFQELWSRISSKSAYAADFDTDELIGKAVDLLNRKLRVPKVCFRVESGGLGRIRSGKQLLEGRAMRRESSAEYGPDSRSALNRNVKYDLVGKLAEETALTRKAIIRILTGIEKAVFHEFKDNPEEFIIRAAALINEEKARAVIGHITYTPLDEKYGTDIFTGVSARGRFGVNAMKARKHLFNYVLYDSEQERVFVEKLEEAEEVAVYVKLPESFSISTPAGRYTPDWAVAFREGTMGHAYLVADRKRAGDSGRFGLTEEAKLHCAGEHFRAVGGEDVVCAAADSFEALMEKVKERFEKGKKDEDKYT